MHQALMPAMLCRATRAHLDQGHLAATEQLLGLLAALTLRNPSAGPLALEADCLSSALQVHHGSQPVQNCASSMPTLPC